jgi:hypothetical protein
MTATAKGVRVDQPGAHSVTGRQKNGLGWMPGVALLILLMTIAIVAFILAAV